MSWGYSYLFLLNSLTHIFRPSIDYSSRLLFFKIFKIIMILIEEKNIFKYVLFEYN